MNLSPTEQSRLLIFSAAEFARRNLRDDVLLSAPEAIAYVTDEAMHLARRGVAYDAIRDAAGSMLDESQVHPGVPAMVKTILVELPMPEGTKLLAVFDPIAPAESGFARDTPGEVLTGPEDLRAFDGEGRKCSITVVNSGDRDIQVRSQTHFFEVNRALTFDRRSAYGMKLAVPSGSGVRFEPGVPKDVPLIPMSGSREVFGFAGLVNGQLDDPGVRQTAFDAAKKNGYLREKGSGDNDFG